MITQPITTTAAPIRILLDPEQSEILADTGHPCFVVVSKASYPRDPRRWIITLISSTIASMDAAVRVATGQSTERKIKPTSKP